MIEWGVMGVAALLSALWWMAADAWLRGRGTGTIARGALVAFVLAQLAILAMVLWPGLAQRVRGEQVPGWRLGLTVAAGAWCFVLVPLGLVGFGAARVVGWIGRGRRGADDQPWSTRERRSGGSLAEARTSST